MQIWQLFIVLRQPLAILATVFSNPKKLTVNMQNAALPFFYIINQFSKSVLLNSNKTSVRNK